jgi:DivIVA domain-containing protein
VGFVLPLIVAAIGVWIAFSIVVWATGEDTLLDTNPAGAPPGLGDGEPVSEAAVGSVKFDTGLRGYRTDQVDAALHRLAWEIGRKDEQLAVLQSKLDGTYEEPADEEPLPEPAEDDALGVEVEDVDDIEDVNDDIDDFDEDADAEREAARADKGEPAPRDLA